IFERCAISEELEIKQEHINETKEDVDRIKQEFINFVIDSTNPRERWLSLFKSLDIRLQFSLFSSLIKHRRPTPDDWCNIFLENSNITFFLSEIFIFSLYSNQLQNLAYLFGFLFGLLYEIPIFLHSNPLGSLGYLFFISAVLFWMFFLYLIFDFALDFSSFFWQMKILIWGIILVISLIFITVIMMLYNKSKSSTTKQIILFLLLLSGVLLWIVLLFNFFWKTTLLVKLISLVAYSILWIYGQNIYRKVTNPLRNIFQSDISINLANLDRFSN
ncbi:MAG: hypothetical protein F6K17_36495, partial [Okeania sp. SIO3C4]|nr:hypothetical protein [Okeania sp. SIO3C4]